MRSPVDSFIAQGYLVVSGALSKKTMDKWVAKAWERLGYDPADPRTWKEEVDLPGELVVPVSELAPRAWEAICSLVGGRERIEGGDWHGWSDCFTVTAGRQTSVVTTPVLREPWRLPIASYPSAGLMVCVFWSGVDSLEPGLEVVADSIAASARQEFGAARRRLVHLGGRPGDVVLLHPFLRYALAPVRRGRLRFMTTRTVELREPLNLDRPISAAFSPVERAVLKALGVPRFDWKPAALSKIPEVPVAPGESAPKTARRGVPPLDCVKSLDRAQVRHFLEKGYVVVKGCFSRKKASDWVEKAALRLDCDPADPKTWKQEMIWMGATTSLPAREFAPKAWAAICDLAGGPGRIAVESNYLWPDAFVVNLGSRKKWEAPGTSAHQKWHLDGPDEPRFLDSPEVGLLAFILWTDIEPRGGGTFIACDSIQRTAQYLSKHPQGVPKQEIPCGAEQYRDFVELIGEAGDVVLLHPFMMHSESRNKSGRPRFMTARMMRLKEPMNFNRTRAAALSPVELCVLRGLGLERLDFKRA